MKTKSIIIPIGKLTIKQLSELSAALHKIMGARLVMTVKPIKKKTPKSDHRCSYTEWERDGYGRYQVCKHCRRSKK